MGQQYSMVARGKLCRKAKTKPRAQQMLRRRHLVETSGHNSSSLGNRKRRRERLRGRNNSNSNSDNNNNNNSQSMTMDVVAKAAGETTKTTKSRQSIVNQTDTKDAIETSQALSVGDRTKLTDVRKLKLRKKLQAVAAQNESLEKTINAKNAEIVELRRSVQSLNDVLNSVPIDELRCNSSIASSKLLDLSKKNRLLRAELETTKNRLNKKDVQIQKLERELKLSEDKQNGDGELVRKTNYLPMDELQAKVNSLQQKLFETRNKNVELQGQLKLAQKCIQQELGENFNLNILANQTQSNWRGRAQQIIHLQQKLHEAKERLDMYERQTPHRIDPFTCHPHSIAPVGAGGISGAGTGGMAKDSISVSTMDTYLSSPKQRGKSKCTNPSIASSGTSLSFDRFAPSVRKSEILHRAKVDELEKQIANLKAQLEDHRSKILALKVRNKTLNDEVVKYKSKANTIDEQTDYNGLNLATINEQLNVQKFQYETRLDEMARQMKDVMKQREEAELHEEEMRRKLNNLETVVAQKDEYIAELDENIRKLEIDMKALCGGFLFSCRELRKEEFIAILDCLETEKTGLIELNRALNERLNKERARNDNISEQLTKSKIFIKRLETKIRDLERELEMQSDRKRRSQRIAEYASSVSATSLNGSVGSFVFENSSLMQPQSKSGDELSKDEVADLRNQLEFATEKITLLEEKITHLTEEKKVDTKTFDEIIVNSKNIILETLMSYKHIQHPVRKPSNTDTDANEPSAPSSASDEQPVILVQDLSPDMDDIDSPAT